MLGLKGPEKVLNDFLRRWLANYFQESKSPLVNPIVSRMRRVSWKMRPAITNCNDTCVVTLANFPLAFRILKSGAGISDCSDVQKCLNFVHVELMAGIVHV